VLLLEFTTVVATQHYIFFITLIIKVLIINNIVINIFIIININKLISFYNFFQTKSKVVILEKTSIIAKIIKVSFLRGTPPCVTIFQCLFSIEL